MAMLVCYCNRRILLLISMVILRPQEVKHHLGPLQGNAYGAAALIALVTHSKLGIPSTYFKITLKTAKTLVAIEKGVL